MDNRKISEAKLVIGYMKLKRISEYYFTPEVENNVANFDALQIIGNAKYMLTVLMEPETVKLMHRTF